MATIPASHGPTPGTLPGFLHRRRAVDYSELSGLRVVKRDPSRGHGGTPGDMLLFQDCVSGRRFICVCTAAPGTWEKVEIT